MSIDDDKVTLSEVREIKRRIATVKAQALKTREEAYEIIRKAMASIAASDETLREIGEIETNQHEAEIEAVAAEGHRLSPSARKLLAPIDGSATDFAFSVIGLTEGGASAATVFSVAGEMGATFTTGAIHAAIHRLVQAGLVAKVEKRKGGTYRLTRTGAQEWSEQIRRSKK